MSKPWIALTVALAVVLALTWRVPQGINSDQASQLRAARQFVAGQSPTLNSVIEPDLGDLSRDRTIFIISRPPAPQLAAYPLLAAGLSPGLTVRILAILCLVAGSIGWLRWFQRFSMPPVVEYTVAAALPFLHEASNSLYVFSQDTLSYAAAPWILLLALGSRRRDFRVGLVLGFTYIIKYSLVFLGLGAGVWLWSRRKSVRLVVGGAIPLVALSIINAHFGPAVNGFAALAGFYPRWGAYIALLANPALGVTDAEGLIRTVLQTGHQFLPAYIALVPGVAFLYLIWRGARLESARALDAAQLAAVVFVTTLIVMAAVWTFSSDYAADTTARHVAPASLAVLPVAALGAADVWRRHGVGVRALVAGLALAIIGGPLGYGAAAVIAKAWRVPSAYHLGPSALLNTYLAPWPGTPDLASVERRIVDQFGPTTDVWYCDYPLAPLDLVGRVWGDVDERYVPPVFRTSKPLRITALLENRDELHGGGSAVRARFLGAGPWAATAIPGANVTVWTTVLQPTSGP